LKKLFREGVHGTRDLPLETLLEPFGIKLAADAATNGTAGKPSLGARVRNGADCVLAAVHENSAAQKAGLSAGDVLVAIDGLRVTGSNLDTLLARYSPGAKVEIHAFRRDELRVTQVKLDSPEVLRYVLSTAEGRGPSKQWRERWLTG
jgi:predicted metalloprotease with PDZ domain